MKPLDETLWEVITSYYEENTYEDFDNVQDPDFIRVILNDVAILEDYDIEYIMSAIPNESELIDYFVEYGIDTHNAPSHYYDLDFDDVLSPEDIFTIIQEELGLLD